MHYTIILISTLGYSPKHCDCITAKGFFLSWWRLNCGGYQLNIGPIAISSVYEKVKRKHLHSSAMETDLVNTKQQQFTLIQRLRGRRILRRGQRTSIRSHWIGSGWCAKRRWRTDDEIACKKQFNEISWWIRFMFRVHEYKTDITESAHNILLLYCYNISNSKAGSGLTRFPSETWLLGFKWIPNSGLIVCNLQISQTDLGFVSVHCFFPHHDMLIQKMSDQLELTPLFICDIFFFLSSLSGLIKRKKSYLTSYQQIRLLVLIPFFSPYPEPIQRLSLSSPPFNLNPLHPFLLQLQARKYFFHFPLMIPHLQCQFHHSRICAVCNVGKTYKLLWACDGDVKLFWVHIEIILVAFGWVTCRNHSRSSNRLEEREC
ncbi:hypothetical protein VP01_811g1 [Puccinia sorghi]|uniref:Uncharacterized protein n=1 Tax=Puccinia sorghi TaxID=27349 RepID=A0A0L6UCB1_9BASI|nr:hypothetical protein VP01_811g1 [Puccinia sorghi]